MDGFDREFNREVPLNPNPNPNFGRRFSDPGGVLSGVSCFDANQYAFFGKTTMEEFELGGLEAEDEDVRLLGDNDERFCFSLGDRTECGGSGSLSGIDDLASTFSKLNRSLSGPRHAGVIGDRASSSRESSSTADWSVDGDPSNWLKHRVLDDENAQGGKRWCSLPFSSYNVAESKPLYRTSSYPDQQPHFFQEDNAITTFPSPDNPFPYYPPTINRAQSSRNITRHSSLPSDSTGLQIPFPIPNISPRSTAQLQLTGLPVGLHNDSNMDHFSDILIPINNQEGNLWLNCDTILSVDHANLMPNLLRQQISRGSNLLNTHIYPQNQLHRFHSLQSSHAPFSHLPQLLIQSSTSSQLLQKFDVTRENRNQRSKTSQRARNLRSNSDLNSQKSENGSIKFRSKYMSSEELENIMKIQHSCSHNNDPYLDDYYHQACIAKRSMGSGSKQHFCPTSIRDLPTRSRGGNDPHVFLQVDAFGRIPFSSIRRPKPLFEVDSMAVCMSSSEQKQSVKSLDQEPMFAARITIEDAMYLLLDVDDIDRLLKYSQPQDGGSQLKRRRQVLLEGFAASLQLVDPFGPGRSGKSSGLAPKDDIVFLRLAAIPKGRKLLSHFFKLLPRGSELARIACMAVFRHLRFLFGGLQLDSSDALTTANLAEVVSSSVHGMDLNALSACLAAVVCSKEQPPLRPLGSSAGDGASIIMKSVLGRATHLLTDSQAASTYSMPARTLWQASFDAFFVLLIRYCSSKYDIIRQSLLTLAPESTSYGSESDKAVRREMPIELLQESLPHTNDHQRDLLLSFAQRTMAAPGTNAPGGGAQLTSSQPMPG